jgi:osmoprotectant transport system permease protein
VIAGGSPVVVPNFGQGSSCVTGDHLFCFGWVKEHWGDTLGPALEQHAVLTGISVGVGFVLAFGLGLFAHRIRKVEQPISVVSALIYTVPSIAAFELLIPFTGLTYTTVEIPLIAYSLVILFPNIVAGLASAPADVLEAGRGMGLTPRQLLTRVELPLALPTIIGGLRIAVVSTISIATIGSTVGGKGLGEPIFYAIQLPTPFKTEIYSAGFLTVAFALLCDGTLVLIRRAVTPWAKARTG